jgi:hypothetical protein
MVNYGYDPSGQIKSSSMVATKRSDLDIVVLLRGVNLAEFQHLVSHMAKVIKFCLESRLKVDVITPTSHGLTFEYEGLEVDVNLAPEYDISSKSLEKEDMLLWKWASNCFVSRQIGKFKELPSHHKVRHCASEIQNCN